MIISFAAVVAIAAGCLVIGAHSARRRALSVSCAGRMFPLTFLALQWAEDSGTNRLPTTLTYLSNHWATRFMVCPDDHSRYSAGSWSSFSTEQSSYELVSPGIAREDTNSVFLRCRVHGHMSYADMTVFDGVRRRHKFE